MSKIKITSTIDVRYLFEVIKDFLRVCPECNEIFIVPGKRKKLYCSNRCAARAGGRRIRAEIKRSGGVEYERYKSQGNRRAKKSYVKNNSIS